jgi:hypothetical protein
VYASEAGAVRQRVLPLFDAANDRTVCVVLPAEGLSSVPSIAIMENNYG